MLERIKRRLSRTKSVSVVDVEPEPGPLQHRFLSLSPSDEQIISKLSSGPDGETLGIDSKLKAHPIVTYSSERTVFNDVSSGFLALPTEILVALQPYLSGSSEVSLRHTCSRFYHLYATRSFYLTGDELFLFLCMKERDQDPTQLDRLVCGKCREMHPRNSFASAEVKQPSHERDCRQIWLCAHKHLGYKKTVKSIKAGVESPFRVENLEPCSRCRDSIRHRSVADRPEKGTSQMDLEDPKAESLLISKVALVQAFAPSYNMRSTGSDSGIYREVFQVKDVSSALQAIDFRLCSHLKLGDPFILSKFCRFCINTQKLPPGVKGPACISDNKREFGEGFGKCKGTCYIRGCGTKFMFQARESLSADASGRRQIWLIIAVFRWLGPLLSAGQDTTWREHSSDHNDRLDMKQKWTDWNTVNRGKPCMPNWSICLLHSNDSNLRS